MSNLAKVLIIIVIITSVTLFLFSCESQVPRVVGLDETGAGIYQKQTGQDNTGASGCYN